MPEGMGYIVDLTAFDSLAQISNPYTASVDVFADRGSVFHIALGAVAGALSGQWAVALSVAFAGYELAKLGSGENVGRIAGTMIEFGLGALLVALAVHFGGRR